MGYYLEPVWELKNIDERLVSSLSLETNIDSEIIKILVARNIDTPEKINNFFSDVPPSYPLSSMKGLIEAGNCLANKIKEGKHIRICADYDVDGVSSAYILFRGLCAVWNRFKTVPPLISIDIPDRNKDGYGLNERMVEAARKDGVNTILTCDNGISCISSIKLAKEYGMTVIVTDHHEVPYTETAHGKEYIYPNADFIVDAHQEGCNYPFKGLCGAGVAYKLVSYLFSLCGFPRGSESCFHGILGLATLADVMELVDENRIYVKNALVRLSQGENLGIKELLKIKDIKELTSYDLGFYLAPCLNSAGRLADAKSALALLLENDEARASAMAKALYELNEERKNITTASTNEIMEEVKNSDLVNDKIMVIYKKGLHPSIMGIIAGRLKEYFHRPVLLCTDDDKGNYCGSGRSIEEYNLFASLQRHSELFRSCGGHEMAAGFDIAPSNLDKLRTVLNSENSLSDKDITPHLYIDTVMALSHNTIQFCEKLKALEPFGKGNESPLFLTENVTLSNFKLLGKAGNAVKFTVSDEHVAITALCFSKPIIEKVLSGASERKANIVYVPEINEWKGNKTVQLIISDLKFI